MDSHNSLHGTPETNKSASCLIGSNFHKDLYNDYTSILEDFVRNVRACTPTLISSSSSSSRNENVSNSSNENNK